MILAIIIAVIVALVLLGAGFIALLNWIARKNMWIDGRPLG